MTKQTIRTEV